VRWSSLLIASFDLSYIKQSRSEFPVGGSLRFSNRPFRYTIIMSSTPSTFGAPTQDLISRFSQLSKGGKSVEISGLEDRSHLDPSKSFCDMSFEVGPASTTDNDARSLRSRVSIVDRKARRWYQVNMSGADTKVGVAGNLSLLSLSALRNDKSLSSLEDMEESPHNDGWSLVRALHDHHEEGVPNTTGDEDEENVTEGNPEDAQEGGLAMHAQLKRLADGGRDALKERAVSDVYVGPPGRMPEATAALGDLVTHLDAKVSNRHKMLAEVVDDQNAVNASKGEKKAS
jgi:hypothetical protein